MKNMINFRHNECKARKSKQDLKQNFSVKVPCRKSEGMKDDVINIMDRGTSCN